MITDSKVEPFQPFRNQIYVESGHLISIECEVTPTLRGSQYEFVILFHDGIFEHKQLRSMDYQQANSFLEGMATGLQIMNLIQSDGK